MFEQSAEEKAFATRQSASRKPKAKGGGTSFVKFYKFRNPKKDGLVDTMFQIIAIPENMKPYFKDKTMPVPRFGGLHTFISVKGKLAERTDVLNMFPDSRVADIRCTGDDTCLVCQKYKEIKSAYAKIEADGGELNSDQQKHLKSLSWNFSKKGKAKEVVIFLAIVYTRNKENRKVWDKELVPMKISSFCWDRDFGKGVFDIRDMKKSKWFDENYEEVFEFDGKDYKLSELDEEAQSDIIKAIYLDNTLQKHPNPWHMLNGYKLTYSQDGEMNADSEVEIGDHSPYFPPAFMKECSAKEKKELKKHEKASKETYDFIVENIENAPDLSTYFAQKITAEEQAEILGVGSVKTEKVYQEDEDDSSNIEDLNDDFGTPDAEPEPEKEDGDTPF